MFTWTIKACLFGMCMNVISPTDFKTHGECISSMQDRVTFLHQMSMTTRTFRENFVVMDMECRYVYNN